jgi:hypothetical protein
MPETLLEAHVGGDERGVVSALQCVVEVMAVALASPRAARRLGPASAASVEELGP